MIPIGVWKTPGETMRRRITPLEIAAGVACALSAFLLWLWLGGRLGLL